MENLRLLLRYKKYRNLKHPHDWEVCSWKKRADENGQFKQRMKVFNLYAWIGSLGSIKSHWKTNQLQRHYGFGGHNNNFEMMNWIEK